MRVSPTSTTFTLSNPIWALAATGLNGLRRLEPGLAVVRSEDEKSRVMVMFEGRVAGSAVAGNGEAAIWAETAFNIVSAARGVSAPLRNATAEEIYEAVFNTISEQLDPYTRYTSADTAREERAQREGFGGIGVVVAAHSDGALIEAVKAGEPAAKTGLQKGDRTFPSVLNRLAASQSSESSAAFAARLANTLKC